MKHLRILLTALFCTGFASSARADVITINASDYPLGTDLSNMFTGLSMNRLSQRDHLPFNPTVSRVLSTGQTLGGGTINLHDYETCSNSPSSFGCVRGFYDVLELRFDAPTDFFQIDAVFFTEDSDIIAYDSLGNRLASLGVTRTYTPWTGGMTRSMITVAHAQSDIARVVYGNGDYLGATSSATQVSYRVPEPTTLGFLAVGLLSAGFLRRPRPVRPATAPPARHSSS